MATLHTLMGKDYYHILGVDKTASKEDIKKAFRTLAHKYHPDKNSGDASKFKEASEAYAVLSDDEKRKQYDTYGSTFSQGGAGASGNPFGDFDFSQFGFGGNAGFSNIDFGDIFGDFFGGASERAPRGRDISVDIELSFSEAIFGTSKTIRVQKMMACNTCKGTGGSGTHACSHCEGKGKVRETRRSILGSFSTVRTCNTCFGTGSVPKETCTACKGGRIVRGEQELTLTIPPGINNKEMLRLSGAGEATPGGTSGDLYVRIHVRPHPTITKDGNDLVTTISIPLSSALLGTTIHIESLGESLPLHIPAGISHGEILKIKGKGVPYGKSKRGDIVAIIHITIPKKLSKNARQHIEELKKEGL